MFNSIILGEKLKNCRKALNITQEEAALKIGVSGQAVSKWEKGECLPDVYNIRLLGKLYRTSIDNLLNMQSETCEKVIESIQIGGVIFEIIEKPETILAGKIFYAKDYNNIEDFYLAFNKVINKLKSGEIKNHVMFDKIIHTVEPIRDICLSVNFWLDANSRAYGFVRETSSKVQPEGVDVYVLPSSLYIKVYMDKASAQLLTKESADVWELFCYTRTFFMPAHGFKMADKGAGELEVYDSFDHKSGYAYVPVMRV